MLGKIGLSKHGLTKCDTRLGYGERIYSETNGG